MTTNVYQPGDEVAIAFAVTDSAGDDYDPSAVKFHYTNPAGTSATKVYGADTDVVSKTAVGHYKLVIFVPYDLASVGTWHYDAQALDSDNHSLLVEPGNFYVESIETL